VNNIKIKLGQHKLQSTLCRPENKQSSIFIFHQINNIIKIIKLKSGQAARKAIDLSMLAT